jgi:hypothetical protein
MTLDDILEKVSIDTNIPKEVVIEAYNSFWGFIRDSIQALPLKEDLTEEEFNKLKCNFNIPSIGKLYVTYPRYRALKDRTKYFKAIQNDYNNKEN